MKKAPALSAENDKLRAQVERLRAALKPFAYEYDILMQQHDSFPSWHSIQTKHLLNASRALMEWDDGRCGAPAVW